MTIANLPTSDSEMPGYWLKLTSDPCTIQSLEGIYKVWRGKNLTVEQAFKQTLIDYVETLNERKTVASQPRGFDEATNRAIETSHAPIPSGHYAQAVKHNGLIFVSGQRPIEPTTNRYVTGPIDEQFVRALDNVAKILIEGGSSLQRVLRCTVYISDLALWPQLEPVYARAFGEHRPARTIVPTMGFDRGFSVEVDAIATVDPKDSGPWIPWQ